MIPTTKIEVEMDRGVTELSAIAGPYSTTAMYGI